jgi:uridine kinase
MTEGYTLGFREFVAELTAQLMLGVSQRQTPLVVGLDGPDCSGKSTLTQALVGELMSACTILPIHFDDFFNPPSFLERSHKDLPLRFREDYFNWSALRTLLTFLTAQPKGGSGIDIVLVEGLFLFEHDRAGYFDFRVRLELSPEIVVERALRRDVGILGNLEWVEGHYRNECLPAQRAYIDSARPGEAAHCHMRIMETAGSVRFSRETS